MYFVIGRRAFPVHLKDNVQSLVLHVDVGEIHVHFQILYLLPDLDASNRTRNHSEGWIPEAAGNLTLEVVGCRDPPQTWCSHVGRIYLFQYGIAMILLAVGYPAANLITYAIFSKILGPFPQVCRRRTVFLLLIII